MENLLKILKHNCTIENKDGKITVNFLDDLSLSEEMEILSKVNSLYNYPPIFVSFKSKRYSKTNYKKGDILISLTGIICIFNKFCNDLSGFNSIFDTKYESDINMHWVSNAFLVANDSDKQKLFEYLDKKGKRWNPEKCIIENKGTDFEIGDVVVSSIGNAIMSYGIVSNIEENTTTFKHIFYYVNSKYNFYNTVHILTNECHKASLEEVESYKELLKTQNLSLKNGKITKWIPDFLDTFYYPSYKPEENIFYPIVNYWCNESKYFLKIRKNNYIFTTKENCQEYCNKLNDAIKNIK